MADRSLSPPAQFAEGGFWDCRGCFGSSRPFYRMGSATRSWAPRSNSKRHRQQIIGAEQSRPPPTVEPRPLSANPRRGSLTRFPAPHGPCGVDRSRPRSPGGRPPHAGGPLRRRPEPSLETARHSFALHWRTAEDIGKQRSRGGRRCAVSLATRRLDQPLALGLALCAWCCC